LLHPESNALKSNTIASNDFIWFGLNNEFIFK
jgi:hypothetical protein